MVNDNTYDHILDSIYDGGIFIKKPFGTESIKEYVRCIDSNKKLISFRDLIDNKIIDHCLIALSTKPTYTENDMTYKLFKNMDKYIFTDIPNLLKEDLITKVREFDNYQNNCISKGDRDFRLKYFDEKEKAYYPIALIRVSFNKNKDSILSINFSVDSILVNNEIDKYVRHYTDLDFLYENYIEFTDTYIENLISSINSYREEIDNDIFINIVEPTHLNLPHSKIIFLGDAYVYNGTRKEFCKDCIESMDEKDLEFLEFISKPIFSIIDSNGNYYDDNAKLSLYDLLMLCDPDEDMVRFDEIGLFLNLIRNDQRSLIEYMIELILPRYRDILIREQNALKIESSNSNVSR